MLTKDPGTPDDRFIYIRLHMYATKRLPPRPDRTLSGPNASVLSPTLPTVIDPSAKHAAKSLPFAVCAAFL